MPTPRYFSPLNDINYSINIKFWMPTQHFLWKFSNRSGTSIFLNFLSNYNLHLVSNLEDNNIVPRVIFYLLINSIKCFFKTHDLSRLIIEAIQLIR